ncbi:fam-b protein [Plasmodium berghei]|uniref:Fam-b protein n=3 Tax=Plasmodium berghei TaxID=5821 RepID=A0A509AIH7_PLABA|nr:fam-b protein [Plasmodium berghei ANKA]XP_034421798.1 fam-b protein [Plasmodium berghei ANKA]CXI06343.1 fam-b protein [Plasmodium berghei]SBW38107.1 fam-b protein [Plasmodium berghei]VUC54413.1 fam-b protein [Plasmodium berghei ANKA]VUC55992.1 fam-b protein [Plasmodium berghei ANKA]|eukprot:XP_034420244.1 fam-b protein [Plasmodium berghei ANKA]
MRVSILKYVLFSIVICSFEYGKNELYFVNDRGICLERNVINFRNNRILAYADNEFDLYDFYQSTLNLANQVNDCNGDDEEIVQLRNLIDSHIKKHKENNTLLDFKNVDNKTKKIINEFRKELEEVKKEFDNKRNDELAIQSIENKKITKKDENNSVSEHENFRQLENCEHVLGTENNKIDLSSNNELENHRRADKAAKKILKRGLLLIGISMMGILSGTLSIPFLVIVTLISADIATKLKKIIKFKFK